MKLFILHFLSSFIMISQLFDIKHKVKHLSAGRHIQSSPGDAAFFKSRKAAADISEPSQVKTGVTLIYSPRQISRNVGQIGEVAGDDAVTVEEIGNQFLPWRNITPFLSSAGTRVYPRRLWQRWQK